MSEIPKEIIDFTGIKAENIDTFKEQFQTKYILREEADKDEKIRGTVSGSVLGKQETKIKQIAKSKGIEFSDDDLMNVKKNEDLIELLLEKQSGGYVNQIESLKKSQGQGSDEAVKEYQEKLEKAQKELSETKAAWKATGQQFESYKAETAIKTREKDINLLVNERKKDLKIKSDLSLAEKKGLETELRERLKFDMDDTSQDLVTMNSKGERIASKVKAGGFASAIEAMQDVVNELGLGEKNVHTNKVIGQINQPVKRNQPSGTTETRIGQPRVHPKAIR